MEDFQPYIHYLEIGELFLKVGEYSKALESFKKLTECPDLAATGWIRLAKIEFILNHRQTAKQYYKKALDLEPTNYAIFYNYANFLVDIQEYPEAIEHYKKALELEPHLALAYYNRVGLSHSKLEQFNEAIEAYLKAMRINPDDFSCHFDLGILYYETDS